MRREGRNVTVLQHGNLSQIIPPAPAWLPLTSQRNGSLVASPASVTESPKRSGIVPERTSIGYTTLDVINNASQGMIAAGIFIILLLALYAILWKCMVSPPKKGKRKRILKGANATV